MSKKRSTEEQIEDLTTQLLHVTKQLDELRIHVQQERAQAEARRTATRPRTASELRIGDHAVVVNNYQNLQGTEGTVIRLSTTFITIRTDTGREITCGNHNIRPI